MNKFDWEDIFFKLSLVLPSIFIIFCITTSYFGFLMPNFENYPLSKCIKNIKKIGKLTMNPEYAGIIFEAKKNLKTIPVYKKILGQIYINEKKYYINESCELFQSDNIEEDYIEVVGEVDLWPIYYKELEKYGLLEHVFAVKIYKYRIDIYINDNVLVQLGNSIEDLAEFYENFPHLFEKNTLIDLRNTRIVGVSKIK